MFVGSCQLKKNTHVSHSMVVTLNRTLITYKFKSSQKFNETGNVLIKKKFYFWIQIK
jgi:hypothetical protein